VVLGFAVFWYYGVLVLWFGWLARRSPFAGRACWEFRAVPFGVALFFDDGKGWMSTPDPRQDGNGFVLDNGV
jgi:hypothetical protein